MTTREQPKGLLILHPRARRYARLEALIGRLEATFDLTIEESRHAGHTQEICRQRLANFQGVVLTAGGDGTLHEAVNAWADLGFPEGPRFAPLPLGTGNDFLYSIDRRMGRARTFLDHPLGLEKNADLGRITFHDEQGNSSSRVFCVGATAGFSALVTIRRAGLASKVPGKLAYILALALSMGSWRNTSCRVENGESSFEHATFYNLNAANARHYGGGMVSAPRADPFAGRIDVVSMNLTRAQAFKLLPRNFSGRFDGVDNVTQFPITGPFTLTTERACPVQADGEAVGRTPMTVECLPARLPILLPLF